MLAFGMQVLFVGFLFVVVLVALIVFPSSQLLREGAAGLGLEFLKGILILGGAIGMVVLITTSCSNSEPTYDSNDYDYEQQKADHRNQLLYEQYLRNGGDPEEWNW